MSLTDSLYDTIRASNSNELVKTISKKMGGSTFHHHYHILYDIRTMLGPEKKIYTEIGTFCGGSATLMMMHPYDTEINNIDPFCAMSGQLDIYKKNINRFNIFDKKVDIHQTYSTNMTFVDKLNKDNFRTDMLFIDGGHHYNDVINDFYRYHMFVNPGGYIIFDDYNDHQYSPDVKPAVDSICKFIKERNLNYEIIGAIDNIQMAHSTPLMDKQNMFILRKKDTAPEIKFAICMASYQRPNGNSRGYLNRSLTSIKNQTCQDYKVFIVGDKYDDDEEFRELVKIIPEDKLYCENLPYANERGRLNGLNLWKVAGGLAVNTATKQAEEEGFTYFLHLDDDDYWAPNRLEILKDTITKYPDAVFYFNYSTYCEAKYNLPREQVTDMYYNNLIPRPSNIIHSSYCWNHKMVPVYVKTFEEGADNTNFECGDIQKLTKIIDFIKNQYGYCVFIPQLLTFKELEQEMLKN